jgi:hypothetical protein
MTIGWQKSSAESCSHRCKVMSETPPYRRRTCAAVKKMSFSSRMVLSPGLRATGVPFESKRRVVFTIVLRNGAPVGQHKAADIGAWLSADAASCAIRGTPRAGHSGRIPSICPLNGELRLRLRGGKWATALCPRCMTTSYRESCAASREKFSPTPAGSLLLIDSSAGTFKNGPSRPASCARSVASAYRPRTNASTCAAQRSSATRFSGSYAARL